MGTNIEALLKIGNWKFQIFRQKVPFTLQFPLLKVTGEPAGTRTQDTRLKRAVLYQLSYRPALAEFFKAAYHNKEPLSLSTQKTYFAFRPRGSAFLKGCSRMIVSSLRAPVEMMAGLTPQSLQSFST